MPNMKYYNDADWTDDMIHRLLDGRSRLLTFKQIAAELGISRSAVAGKLHRIRNVHLRVGYQNLESADEILPAIVAALEQPITKEKFHEGDKVCLSNEYLSRHPSHLPVEGGVIERLKWKWADNDTALIVGVRWRDCSSLSMYRANDLILSDR